ncbi:MAG: hypothetical protein ABUL72_03800 [Armatimonadota bacterium]
MSHDFAVFIAKFAHTDWFYYLFLEVLAVGVSWLCVDRWRKKSRAVGLLPMTMLWGSRALFGVSALFFVFTQLHLGCAKLAAEKTSCLASTKMLSKAEKLYAADYDDYLPVTDNWMTLTKPYLSSPIPGCASAPLDRAYGMNKALKGVSIGTVEDPFNTVVVFETKGPTVGGSSDLAVGRHTRLNFATSDGEGKSRSDWVRMVWTPAFAGAISR